MNDREVARQLIHSTGLVVIFLAFIIGKDLVGLGGLLLSIAILIISGYTKKKEEIRNKLPLRVKFLERVEDGVYDVFNSLEREEYLRTRPYLGAFTFFLAISLALLFFPLNISSIAIVVLVIGDSIATIVGIHYGKHKLPYNRRKSLEGSLSGLVASFLACMVLANPLTAFLAASIGIIVESLPIPVNDNISIPVSVAVFLFILGLV